MAQQHAEPYHAGTAVSGFRTASSKAANSTSRPSILLRARASLQRCGVQSS